MSFLKDVAKYALNDLERSAREQGKNYEKIANREDLSDATRQKAAELAQGRNIVADKANQWKKSIK